MARGQGAARDHRAPAALSAPAASASGDPRGIAPGGSARPTLAVAIRDLAEARALLDAAEALGVEVELVTVPGLAAFAGVGFCVALERALGRSILIDCGAEPGIALAALRAGARRVLLAGAPAVQGKLADIARQLGAELRSTPPPGLLRPPPETAAAEALHRALSADAAPDPSSASAERL